MLFLIIYKKYKRDKLYEQVKLNWRTILLWSEYDKDGNQTRNFKNGFE